MTKSHIIEVALALLVLAAIATCFLWQNRSRSRKSDAPLVTAKTSSDTEEYSAPIELFVGPSSESSVLSISSVPQNSIDQRIKPKRLETVQLNSLIPLFQLAPNILSAAEFRNGNYMKVVINVPLALNSDGTDFLPFGRTENGRISEVARLKDPQLMTSSLKSAVFFQLASIILAQKHLADISQNLSKIRCDVANIKEFLEVERRAKIKSAIEYLYQQIPSIKNSEFSEAVRGELERIERDLLQLHNQLTTDLTREIGLIPSLNEGTFFGTKGQFEAIKRCQSHLTDLWRQWVLCLEARAVNWQVLYVYPKGPALKRTRLDAIQKSTEGILGKDENALEQKHEEEMLQKIEALHSHFNLDETLSSRKSELRNDMPDINQMTLPIIERLAQLRAILDIDQKPVTYFLRIEAGKVLEAYEQLSS